MIRRVRLHHILAGMRIDEFPHRDTVIDCRTCDIPNTIVAMIRSFPRNVIAVSLRPEGGPAMIAKAERAARRNEMRIIWVPRK